MLGKRTDLAFGYLLVECTRITGVEPPPNSESCACGVNNTCLPDKKKKCNCDARSNSWTKDEGFLTATDDLPVTQVVFRDVNPDKDSEANFTVGNLYCSGEHCDYYLDYL